MIIEIKNIPQLKSEISKVGGKEIDIHYECSECKAAQVIDRLIVKDGDLYMMLNHESLCLNWECMECGCGDDYLYANNITAINTSASE